MRRSLVILLGVVAAVLLTLGHAEAAEDVPVPVVKGWKPWKIGHLADVAPEKASQAAYAALAWEEGMIRKKTEAHRREIPRRPRLAERRARVSEGDEAPEWYHYMPPWWERPDTPEMPKTDFPATDDLKALSKPTPGTVPIFNPFDHILLQLNEIRGRGIAPVRLGRGSARERPETTALPSDGSHAQRSQTTPPYQLQT